MFGLAQADCGVEGKNMQKVCAAYLQTEELDMQMQEETGTQEAGRENSEEILQWHPISVSCFSEVYSEKMYEEQVYKMGLMAHAYYRGWLRQQETLDMEQLEQEYRNNIYSRMSSERAALHGIYKMASIGVDRNRPGRFRAYFEKISDQKDEEYYKEIEAAGVTIRRVDIKEWKEASRSVYEAYEKEFGAIIEQIKNIKYKSE